MPPSSQVLPGRFRPRLTLRTLNRGDGLLGLRPHGPFGPRGTQVTVARIDWTYTADHGLDWSTPAPVSVLGLRPEPQVPLQDASHRTWVLMRDLASEAQALDQVRAMDLHPLPAEALQWRAPQAAEGHEHLWSLVQEDFFGDFWADQLPLLQAAGWSVVIFPGFAHESVPIERWHMLIDPATGEVQGREVLQAGTVDAVPAVRALRLARREGAWLLTLGVEIEGQTVDLAPMLAQLLRRDARWLDARQIAAIDDDECILLRAPGGRRIEAPAAPLKAIVASMIDLITDPKRAEGPLVLSPWDMHRLQALRLALTQTQAARAGPKGAWQLQGDTGLQDLARRLAGHGSPRPVEPPAGLGLSLRPYQLHGVSWLQYLRQQDLAGILADDMGLGKTAQALAHVLIEQQAGRLVDPALVVVPTSLMSNWQDEARRVAPALRVLTLHGPARQADFARIPDHDLVLTTYPLLQRDVLSLQSRRFHLLILDEAQMVKNATSRTASAVRRLRAPHRLCLTGTPLENHLGELWAQFDLLMPGFLGDARHFKRQWRDPIEINGETLRARLLADRVRPFILRRRKADVAPELPPRTEVIRRVALQGAQRALYESVRVAADKQVRRVLERSGLNGGLISVLDALLKLRQVCCDPSLVKGLSSDQALSPSMPRAKIELLRALLPQLVEEGRRVLVFSQFTSMLSLIEAELQGLGLSSLSLTGRTPPEQRGELVRRYQAREAPVFLVSLKAGGTGLNLTAADTVIHVDPWWNPAVQEQATARAHRLGQTQPVFVYTLIVAGSIEERMLELQARKGALAEGVLGHDEALAAKFTPEDLRRLLAPLPDD